MKLLLGLFLIFGYWNQIVAKNFSANQYQQIMSYIKIISKPVYDVLAQCELNRHQPCLQKVENISEQGLVFPQGDAQGYAILKIPLMHNWLVKDAKSNLSGLVSLYEKFLLIYGNRMPLYNCEYILNLIKMLD